MMMMMMMMMTNLAFYRKFDKLEKFITKSDDLFNNSISYGHLIYVLLFACRLYRRYLMIIRFVDLRDGPKHPYVTVLDFYICV